MSAICDGLTIRKFSARTAIMLLGCILLTFLAAPTWAATSTFNGLSWQIGDVIVCSGGGKCNVMRIVGGTPVLLDQISDTLLGDNSGVAVNNTVHAVVTDNQGGGGSKVVVYSIASVDPKTGSPIKHTPVQIFDASGGPNSANAQAIAFNSAGHMFVANAGSGGTPVPAIVELDAHGVPVGAPHTIPNSCIDTQLAKIDLSADSASVYLTSQGGTIQNFSLTTNTCTPFANLGSGARFDGIRDLPAGVLGAVTPDCKGAACPSGESVLAVARGFFDSNGDGSTDQAHDNNVCTGLLNSSLVSCALLLKPGSPGLTAASWLAGHQYSTGEKVLDANLHVQQVATAGTSGSYAATPFNPSWSTTGGTTVDNRVTWQDTGVVCTVECPPAWSADTAYLVGDTITDPAEHIQEVTVAGTSGPSIPTFDDEDGTTLDGLTWTDLGTSVVARYPVTSVSTLQALTLDPFITDCTGSSGTACNAGFTAAPKISNFLVADSGSANFYALDFATGTSTLFNANLSCTGCSSVSSIQGIGIYGGEGANQPGLAALLPSTLIGTNPATNTKTVQFVGNTETVNLYNLTSPVNLALYASLVDGGSCFNDQNSALPCKNTTSLPGKAIVWKIDVPKGGTDPLSAVSIAAKYIGASGTVNNGTDVFTDMLYDTTVLVGNDDPTQFTKASVQSLHQVPFTATGGANCTFSSPVSNTCYKSNRSTLPFVISQCPGMSVANFSTLGLQSPAGGLSLVQTFGTSQAPLPVNLSGAKAGATNNKASFRYDASKNQWVYQLALSTLGTQIPGTFTGCAFDSTQKAQTFCGRNVTIKSSCP